MHMPTLTRGPMVLLTLLVSSPTPGLVAPVVEGEVRLAPASALDVSGASYDGGAEVFLVVDARTDKVTALFRGREPRWQFSVAALGAGQPQDIAHDPVEDHFDLLDVGSNRVTVVERSGLPVRTLELGAQLDAPSGLVCQSGDGLLVLDEGGGVGWFIDPQTGDFRDHFDLTALPAPDARGAAFDPTTGRYCIADARSDGALWVDLRGRSPRQADLAAQGIAGPGGLALVLTVTGLARPLLLNGEVAADFSSIRFPEPVGLLLRDASR